MKRKSMRPKLRRLFMALDSDGKDEVDLKGFLAAPEEFKEQVTRIIDMDHFTEIFRLLDVDCSGTVDIDEFVDGLIRSSADKPSELLVLMKMGRTIIDLLQTGRGPGAGFQRTKSKAGLNW